MLAPHQVGRPRWLSVAVEPVTMAELMALLVRLTRAKVEQQPIFSVYTYRVRFKNTSLGMRRWLGVIPEGERPRSLKRCQYCIGVCTKVDATIGYLPCMKQALVTFPGNPSQSVVIGCMQHRKSTNRFDDIFLGTFKQTDDFGEGRTYVRVSIPAAGHDLAKCREAILWYNWSYSPVHDSKCCLNSCHILKWKHPCYKLPENYAKAINVNLLTV
ncbi:hypothetical protein BHM03_00032241 [Ensete ventricosum]|nr:hypothetical protein BHM03_00032241 [Ensete ventricosum]